MRTTTQKPNDKGDPDQGGKNREQRAGSREQGAGSREEGERREAMVMVVVEREWEERSKSAHCSREI